MDPILYWNEVALEANRISHTNGKNEQAGPTLSSRALAIVHLAMYDAYIGVKPSGLTRYLPSVPGPEMGASEDAAVAAAAQFTLAVLFPSQKAFFERKHAEAGLSGAGFIKGREFGVRVAKAILEDRKDDPDASDRGYAPSLARGAHRPDPDNPDQGFHAPFYGELSKCFSVKKRYGLNAPPTPGDTAYDEALTQVRARGIAPELTGTLPNNLPKRTVDQTLIGIYWGYDGRPQLGTPPRLYNQIIREVAQKKNTKGDTAQYAHLFALVNVAMADAGILAWEQKYNHDLWRPVVGIREHDPSMGPTGTPNNDIDNSCDTGWLPLGAPASNSTTREQTPASSAYPCTHTLTSMDKNFTPPFPAYPSGHATFGAAAFQIVRRYYKDDKEGSDSLFNGLSFVSDEFNGVTKDNKGTVRPRHVRSFPRGLWQMIEENGESRVNLGVHWEFDAFLRKADKSIDLSKNVGGVPLGYNIANDIFKNSAKGINKSTV